MSQDKVLGVIGLGSMGYGAAVSAMRRGVATWGLDTGEAARARFAPAGGQRAVAPRRVQSVADPFDPLGRQ